MLWIIESNLSCCTETQQITKLSVYCSIIHVAGNELQSQTFDLDAIVRIKLYDKFCGSKYI